MIASQYGIFEASRYLRHSDIRITAAFYADKKQQVVPDLTWLVSLSREWLFQSSKLAIRASAMG
ncbi:MAG: hypothetical protein L7V86_08575 [Verrucomicrobiales bacterium]|nr:hypothetical protein [Verrucomicrobiales bacterium]